MAAKRLVHLYVILSILDLLNAATQHMICSSYNGSWPPSAKYKMGGCYVLKLKGSVEKCDIYGGLIRMVQMPKEEGAKCMMSPHDRTLHCLCPTVSGLLSRNEYQNCKDSALMKAYNDKRIPCAIEITAEERLIVASKPPTTAVKLPSTFKPSRLSSTLSGYANESQVIVTDSAEHDIQRQRKEVLARAKLKLLVVTAVMTTGLLIQFLLITRLRQLIREYYEQELLISEASKEKQRRSRKSSSSKSSARKRSRSVKQRKLVGISKDRKEDTSSRTASLSSKTLDYFELPKERRKQSVRTVSKGINEQKPTTIRKSPDSPRTKKI